MPLEEDILEPIFSSMDRIRDSVFSRRLTTLVKVLVRSPKADRTAAELSPELREYCKLLGFFFNLSCPVGVYLGFFFNLGCPVGVGPISEAAGDSFLD